MNTVINVVANTLATILLIFLYTYGEVYTLVWWQQIFVMGLCWGIYRRSGGMPFMPFGSNDDDDSEFLHRQPEMHQEQSFNPRGGQLNRQQIEIGEFIWGRPFHSEFEAGWKIPPPEAIDWCNPNGFPFSNSEAGFEAWIDCLEFDRQTPQELWSLNKEEINELFHMAQRGLSLCTPLWKLLDKQDRSNGKKHKKKKKKNKSSNSDANEETIKEWHRSLAMKWHPDKGGDDKIMGAINDAKDDLLDRLK